jgi:hypothetical protein
VLILLGAAALRCYGLDRFSMGNDEIEEIRWSRLPFFEMLHVTGADGAHPPLEFAVQALLTRAGASDPVRRVPSVVAGLLTVALSIVLSMKWFGEVAGLVTGALLSCAPIHVRFSQEVRPYSIGLLFLVGSLLALEEYRRGRKEWLAAVWFMAVLASGYTLYFAGLVSVLVSVAFLYAYRDTTLRRLWRRLPVVLLAWTILYAPWIPSVLSVAGRRPPVEHEVINSAWLRYRLQTLATGDWAVEPVSPGSYAFWALVLVGLGAALASRPGAVTAIWLVAGGLAQLLILQWRPHYPAVHHFLPSWLATVFLAGCAMAALNRRGIAGTLGWAAIALVLFFDAQTLVAYYDHGRPEWDGVAKYLRTSIRPGERLIAANGWAYRNLGYYWTDEGLGLAGVRLEHAGSELVGPAWLIMAVCPVDPGVRKEIERLPVRRVFPMTNHCEIRFVPPGRRIELPHGCCTPDV